MFRRADIPRLREIPPEGPGDTVADTSWSGSTGPSVHAQKALFICAQADGPVEPDHDVLATDALTSRPKGTDGFSRGPGISADVSDDFRPSRHGPAFPGHLSRQGAGPGGRRSRARRESERG